VDFIAVFSLPKPFVPGYVRGKQQSNKQNEERWAVKLKEEAEIIMTSASHRLIEP